jgi:phage terminase small subunit
MAKNYTKEYVEELKQMIELRTGKPFEIWLMPSVRTTAMNMAFLDRLQDQVMEVDLTTSMTGSMGQQKIEVNPLIDKYNNTVNTLIKLFKALGLSYDTASGKIASADDGDNDDPVLAALKHK